MSRLLFVYGTLHPSCAPRILSDLIGRMRLIGAATVTGRLYNLGAYPGLILNPACGAVVHGNVFELPADDSALSRIDAYEGVNPMHPEQSLFARVKCNPTLADGSIVQAWVYVYNQSVESRPTIESGRWDSLKRKAVKA